MPKSTKESETRVIKGEVKPDIAQFARQLFQITPVRPQAWSVRLSYSVRHPWTGPGPKQTSPQSRPRQQTQQP